MSKVKYYKITNETETHRSFRYKDGLNIDTNEFVTDILPLKFPAEVQRRTDSLDNLYLERGCEYPGLYFGRLDQLFPYICFGIYLREVEIPKGAKVIHDPFKSRADSLILGKRHDLLSVEGMKMILQNTYRPDLGYALVYAAARGKVPLVEYLLDKGADIHYGSDGPIKRATFYRHSDIVELLLSRAEFSEITTGYCLTTAVVNKDTNTLDLLLRHGVSPFYANGFAVRRASWDNCFDMVEMFIHAMDTDKHHYLAEKKGLLKEIIQTSKKTQACPELIRRLENLQGF